MIIYITGIAVRNNLKVTSRKSHKFFAITDYMRKYLICRRLPSLLNALKVCYYKAMFSLMKRHSSLIGACILAVYIAIPFIDSIACDDCVGNVPFQGEITISHKQMPHADVTLSISKSDSHNQTSGQKETKSYCAICFNTAMGVCLYNHILQLPISEFESHPTPELPLELSFPIMKPPQNYPFS